MAEYIEREAAVDAVTDVFYSTPDICLSWDKFEVSLRRILAANVAPVVHGVWGDNGIPGSMLRGCSVCGFTCGAPSFRYCPMCGAKMDGGGVE